MRPRAVSCLKMRANTTGSGFSIPSPNPRHSGRTLCELTHVDPADSPPCHGDGDSHIAVCSLLPSNVMSAAKIGSRLLRHSIRHVMTLHDHHRDFAKARLTKGPIAGSGAEAVQQVILAQNTNPLGSTLLCQRKGILRLESEGSLFVSSPFLGRPVPLPHAFT